MNRSARNPVVFNSPPTHFQQHFQQLPFKHQPPPNISRSPDFRPQPKPNSSMPYYREQNVIKAPPSRPKQPVDEPNNRKKFKEMTDDLAKLKQQLQDIMVNSSAQKLRGGANIAGNKSSDNLYAPHQRQGQYKVPLIHLEQNGYKQKPIQKNDDRSKSISLQRINEKIKSQPRQMRQQRKLQKFPAYELIKKAQPSGKYNFFNQNPSDRGDKRVAIVENPNRKQAVKRDTLQKQRFGKSQILNYEPEKSIKNDEYEKNIGNFRPQRNNKNQEHEKNIKNYEPQKKMKSYEPERNLKSYNYEIQNNRINYQSEKPLETSERRNLKFQLQKVKTQMQEKIDKLQLQNSNLTYKNENLVSDLQRLRQKLKESEQKNLNAVEQNKRIKGRSDMLQQKIRKLEENLMESRSQKRDSFDHVLIDQLQETAKFRDQLEEKNDQIARLNEIILLNRRKAEEAINEGSIQKIKYLSEMKQQQQTHEIKIISLENEVKNSKHAMETMAAKLQSAIRQIKSKDEFLQQHLVGRLKSGQEQQYVKNFLKKYEIQFSQNRLMQKLLQEEKIIQDLKRKLRER